MCEAGEFPNIARNPEPDGIQLDSKFRRVEYNRLQVVRYRQRLLAGDLIRLRQTVKGIR